MATMALSLPLSLSLSLSLDLNGNSHRKPMIFSKYRGFPVSLGLFHNSNQIAGGKKTYHLLVSRIGVIFFLELDWTVFWKAGCNVDPICFAAWGASSQVRTDNTMNKNYQIAVVNDV